MGQTATTDAVRSIQELRDHVLAAGAAQQQALIERDSPYSAEINGAIANYEEFRIYYDLHLREAMVTRRALIKELDLDLWVSCEGCTNRELMLKGLAPYAYDAEDGKLELHHIGQDPNGPFAELTFPAAFHLLTFGIHAVVQALEHKVDPLCNLVQLVLVQSLKLRYNRFDPVHKALLTTRNPLNYIIADWLQLVKRIVHKNAGVFRVFGLFERYQQ